MYLRLAYQIRKSEVLAWDRNSYLTNVISPKKRKFLHEFGLQWLYRTLSLGWRHCEVTIKSWEVCKKKNQTRVFGADSKFHPSGVGTEFSIHTSHPCKIVIVLQDVLYHKVNQIILLHFTGMGTHDMDSVKDTSRTWRKSNRSWHITWFTSYGNCFIRQDI